MGGLQAGGRGGSDVLEHLASRDPSQSLVHCLGPWTGCRSRWLLWGCRVAVPGSSRPSPAPPHSEATWSTDHRGCSQPSPCHWAPMGTDGGQGTLWGAPGGAEPGSPQWLTCFSLSAHPPQKAEIGLHVPGGSICTSRHMCTSFLKEKRGRMSCLSGGWVGEA